MKLFGLFCVSDGYETIFFYTPPKIGFIFLGDDFYPSAIDSIKMLSFIILLIVSIAWFYACIITFFILFVRVVGIFKYRNKGKDDIAAHFDFRIKATY